MVQRSNNASNYPNVTGENNLITSDQVSKFLSCVGVGDNLTQKEKEQFIQICILQNLNPFKREVYPVKYNKNSEFQILTGYEVYLKRAERTGLLEHFNVYSTNEINPFTGKNELVSYCEIERTDKSKTLIFKAYYSEFVKYTNKGEPNKFWIQMPIGMLEKCVISKAFRLAFPDEIAGMPYTSDEMQVSEFENIQQKNKRKEEEINSQNEQLKSLYSKIDTFSGENKAFLGPEYSQIEASKNKKITITYLHTLFAQLKISTEKNILLDTLKNTMLDSKIYKESTINRVVSLASKNDTEHIKKRIQDCKDNIKDHDKKEALKKQEEEKDEEISYIPEEKQEDLLKREDINISIKEYDTMYQFPSIDAMNYEEGSIERFLSRFEGYYTRITKNQNIIVNDMTKYISAFQDFGILLSTSSTNIKHLDSYLTRISKLVSNWQLLDKSTHVKDVIENNIESILYHDNLNKDKNHKAKMIGQRYNNSKREKSYNKSMGV